MYKKYFSVAVLIFLNLTFIGNVAFAQSEPLSLFFSQKHYYSVIFRGNGEAIVYARLVITNPEDKPMTDFSFEVPKVVTTEMMMLQQTLPPRCARYDYSKTNVSPYPCLEYTEPDYSSGYYYDYYGGQSAQYKKIKYTHEANLYKFSLPAPIEPQKTGVVILAYTARGYVDKSLGVFRFNFETLKVPSRIQEIKVAVDVDSDLYLKGKLANVNYGVTSMQGALASPPSESFSNKGLDQAVGQIGSYGALVKDAKNLSPNESFSVKGEYSTSWFLLYLKSFSLAIFIIAVVIGGLYCLVRFLRVRNAGKANIASSTGASVVQAADNSEMMVLLNIKNVLLGLLSTACVAGLSAVLVFLGRAYPSWSYNGDELLMLMIVVTVIFFYVLVVLGPAIFAAIKQGWRGLLAVLVWEFLWLLVFFVLYIILFKSGLTSPFPVYPMMQGGGVAPAL